MEWNGAALSVPVSSLPNEGKGSLRPFLIWAFISLVSLLLTISTLVFL